MRAFVRTLLRNVGRKKRAKKRKTSVLRKSKRVYRRRNRNGA